MLVICRSNGYARWRHVALNVGRNCRRTSPKVEQVLSLSLSHLIYYPPEPHLEAADQLWTFLCSKTGKHLVKAHLLLHHTHYSHYHHTHCSEHHTLATLTITHTCYSSPHHAHFLTITVLTILTVTTHCFHHHRIRTTPIIVILTTLTITHSLLSQSPNSLLSPPPHSLL